jgi:hypothetical protein
LALTSWIVSSTFFESAKALKERSASAIAAHKEYERYSQLFAGQFAILARLQTLPVAAGASSNWFGGDLTTNQQMVTDLILQQLTGMPLLVGQALGQTSDWRDDVEQEVKAVGIKTPTAWPMFSPDDVSDLKAFATRLAHHRKYDFLSQDLQAASSEALDEYLNANRKPKRFQSLLVTRLNEIITDTNRLLLDQHSFADVELRSVTRVMVEHERTGKDLVLRNRLVLEDIYPEALRTQNSFASELAAVSMSLSLVSSNWSNVIVSNMVLKPYMTLMREADVSQKGLDEIRKLVSDQTSAALETFRNVAFVDASLSRISSDVLPILNQFAEGAERRAKVIQYLSFFCYFFGAILVIWGKIIEGKSRRSSDGGDTAEADV